MWLRWGGGEGEVGGGSVSPHCRAEFQLNEVKIQGQPCDKSRRGGWEINSAAALLSYLHFLLFLPGTAGSETCKKEFVAIN